jgi:hypothetical protein
MLNRTTTEWLMLGAAGVAAAVVAYFLIGGSIEAALAYVLASIFALGLVGGVILLSLASRSVSTAATIAWASPGVLALVPFVGAALQRGLDAPLGLGGLLVSTAILAAAGGAVSPVTSAAATAFAWRSRRRSHTWWAGCSWLGALLFWGRVSGLIPSDW